MLECKSMGNIEFRVPGRGSGSHPPAKAGIYSTGLAYRIVPAWQFLL